MTVKFKRATHDPNGRFRRDMEPLWDATIDWQIHMLESNRPMSFDELVAACNRYHDDFQEEHESAPEIALALVRMLEVNAVVIAKEEP